MIFFRTYKDTLIFKSCKRQAKIFFKSEKHARNWSRIRCHLVKLSFKIEHQVDIFISLLSSSQAQRMHGKISYSNKKNKRRMT